MPSRKQPGGLPGRKSSFRGREAFGTLRGGSSAAGEISVAELDQTARYALKIAPAEALAWLLPGLDADLGFTRWLDTETIAFPGEPGRRCDTVAELVSRGGRSAPWALVLEAEARPSPTILDRVLEYEARLLRRLRHGPRRRDRYLVAAVVIFLRGHKKELRLQMDLPGTSLGLGLRVGAMSLAREQAAATLERIGRGELGRSILPWVPLMAGGDEAAVVAEWVRLAAGEADAQRRADYPGLALVFADSVGRLPVWKQALEGFDMWESQVIREWKTAGRVEGRVEQLRNNLRQVLRSRFQSELPADLAQRIEQLTDLDVLMRWFDAALAMPTLDAFRNAVQTPVSSAAQNS